MIFGFSLRRVPEVSRFSKAMVPVLAIVAGLSLGALLVTVSGGSAGEAYRAMFEGSLGSAYGIRATLLRSVPLVLTGLAVSLALRMQLWNIGGEGQLLMGAAAATWAGFAFSGLSSGLLTVVMLLAAIIGGAMWAQIAAIPKATIGLNEIIVTLFLNYIGIRAVSYLVYGPWKDPGAIGFAYSKPVPARLGRIPGTDLSVSLLIVVLVLVLMWWLFNRTAWGFSIDVAGGNDRAANYLGFSSKRPVLVVFAISGGIAGLAGGIQLMGATGRLQPDLAAGYGYAGILVAFLAGRSIAGVLATGLFFGALLQGGFALQSTGVTNSLSTVNQALVILFVIIGNGVIMYRVVRRKRQRLGESAAAGEAA